MVLVVDAPVMVNVGRVGYARKSERGKKKKEDGKAMGHGSRSGGRNTEGVERGWG